MSPMTTHRRWGAIVLAGLVVAIGGCSPSFSGEPSVLESAGASAAFAGTMPSGCEPVPLFDPGGARVDLTGAWAGTGSLIGVGETLWLNQVGSCVFGSIQAADDTDGSRGIANLTGRLERDFMIEMEVVMVLEEGFLSSFGDYTTIGMALEWDPDGRMSLRELPGSPTRCIGNDFGCEPEPITWHPVE